MDVIEKVVKGLACGSCSECPYLFSENCEKEAKIDAIELLKTLPQIVLCLDCRYYHAPQEGCMMGDCTFHSAWFPTRPEDYCSHGEHCTPLHIDS